MCNCGRKRGQREVDERVNEGEMGHGGAKSKRGEVKRKGREKKTDSTLLVIELNI